MPGELIAGTDKADKVKGINGPDRIKARAANDLVKARGGAPDRAARVADSQFVQEPIRERALIARRE